MEIEPDLSVLIRAPYYMPKKEIDSFLDRSMDWIVKHRDEASRRMREREETPALSMEEIRQLADQAVKEIPERVRYYAPLVGVTYGRITIRNQKSRWGSCSSKGNLNFNCLLLLAPPDVMDYVIVHELCHRKEMNHSPQFWAEVARIMPDYETHRKWLKENGDRLLAMVERN